MSKKPEEKESYRPEDVLQYNQDHMRRLLTFLSTDANGKVVTSGGNYTHTALIYDLEALDREGGLRLTMSGQGNLGAEQNNRVIVLDADLHHIRPANCTIANFEDSLVMADCLLLSGMPRIGEEVNQLRGNPAPKVDYQVLNGGKLIVHSIGEEEGEKMEWRYHYVGNFPDSEQITHAWMSCSKPIRRGGNCRERKQLPIKSLKLAVEKLLA